MRREKRRQQQGWWRHFNTRFGEKQGSDVRKNSTRTSGLPGNLFSWSAERKYFAKYHNTINRDVALRKKAYVTSETRKACSQARTKYAKRWTGSRQWRPRHKTQRLMCENGNNFRCVEFTGTQETFERQLSDSASTCRDFTHHENCRQQQ